MQPLWQLSATALVAGFKEQRWTPVDALLSVKQRLAAINPLINAIVTLAPDAEAAAQASTQRYIDAKPLSEIDGVPISVKDNLLLKGSTSTWGTPALKHYIPDHDELPVARLRQAGAILFAKTNVPEFTLEGYTGNPIYGVTRNPWDLSTTPGGSSGGAAASIAAGIGPIALCTDGGGSIRRPAAHCGLVGLKPSIGTIARGNGFPSLLLDMEVVGPITRTIDDAELTLKILSGPDARDRLSLATPRPSLIPVKSILCVTAMDNAPVDKNICMQVEQAANTLEEQGLIIEYGALPIDLTALNAVWSQIGQQGMAFLAQKNPVWVSQASPPYQEMATSGAFLSSTTLWNGLNEIAQLRNQIDQLFEQYDAILMPSIAALAWKAEERFPNTIDNEAVGPRGHAIFTGWVNACGCPALNVPTQPANNGQAIGMQLIGSMGSELSLLAIGRTLEKHINWQERLLGLWTAQNNENTQQPNASTASNL